MSGQLQLQLLRPSLAETSIDQRHAGAVQVLEDEHDHLGVGDRLDLLLAVVMPEVEQ
jgi:hypothetical protein